MFLLVNDSNIYLFLLINNSDVCLFLLNPPDRGYVLHTDPLRHELAADRCEDDGKVLMTPRTQADIDVLKTLVEPGQQLYTGLHHLNYPESLWGAGPAPMYYSCISLNTYHWTLNALDDCRGVALAFVCQTRSEFNDV